jgi:hypothetical protein
MTPEQQAELRDIAEAATQGPWTADDQNDPSDEVGICAHIPGAEHPVLIAEAFFHEEMNARNADHIAAFDPPAVLELLVALRDAELERDSILRALPHDWKAQNKRAEAAEAKSAALLADLKAMVDEWAYGSGSDGWHAEKLTDLIAKHEGDGS